jgi:hypothetical protein
MKKIYFLVISFFALNSSFAQISKLPNGGGEYKISSTQAECITENQRTEIKNYLQKNIDNLISSGKIKNTKNMKNQMSHPLFIWPVSKTTDAPYNSVWSIGNYIDHNSSYPNQLQDWNCGTRTYDTATGYNHQGIDIGTWPFSFFQMDNNHAIAVAAADGVIIGKYDGNFDRNCSMNSNTWNAVYIQHADGSQSWYGHLKSGSLTTKNAGDTVTAGEFLGVIGSSGSSTGPHLHFEVYNSLNQLVDTYSGACNNWPSSTDSWWVSQKPYINPNINAVFTHSSPPQFNSCPTTEIPNINDNFSSGSDVITAVYLADQTAGSTLYLTIKRPDNSILANWVFNLTDQYAVSYWYWTFPSANFSQQSGNYQFIVTYQGNTVTHNFYYGDLNVNENFEQKFKLYPNPSNEFITVMSKDNSPIDTIGIYDLSGKKVLDFENPSSKINISSLQVGVYLIKIKSIGIEFTSKFFKK